MSGIAASSHLISPCEGAGEGGIAVFFRPTLARSFAVAPNDDDNGRAGIAEPQTTRLSLSGPS